MRPPRGKQKLLDAATRLFAKQGYFSTTVEQITAEAGVSKGLVYNYFASKEELLVGLIEATTVRMSEVASSIDLGDSVEEALQVFLDAYFDYLKAEGTFLSLQLQLMLTPELRPIVEETQQVRATLLLKQFSGWFRRMGLREPKGKARLFLAMLDGVALHYLCVYENYPLGTMRRQVLEAANGICATKQ